MHSGRFSLLRVESWLSGLAVFTVGAAVFYALRGWAITGGDTSSILSPMCNYLWGDRLVWYSREPLGHLLPLIAYWGTHDIVSAFQLVSALLGGLWLVALMRFTRHPGFLLVCLSSAITFNFIGHIEYYAPVVVALTVYFLLLTRALEPEPRARPGGVLLAFGLAWLCHKMALVFAPTLLWLIVRRTGAGWGRRHWPADDWQRALLALIAAFLIDIVPGLIQLLNPGPVLVVQRSDTVWELLNPLTVEMGRAIAARSPTGVFFHFSMGQWAHWLHFAGFWLMGAPLGVVVLVACRRRLRGEPALALASALLLAVVWTFLWHPHMGWYDWDLFTLGALPANLLAGGLWAGIFGQPAESGRVASKVFAPHKR